MFLMVQLLLVAHPVLLNIELKTSQEVIKMKVLQINVRLKEGGAARVALDLHMRGLESGLESCFAYGYSFKAGKSEYEGVIPNVFQCGDRFSVIGNYFSHKLTGGDIIPPIGKKNELIAAIVSSDIIHLHVIHSYFLPYEWLFGLLKELKKNIVWTIHDAWPLTGRCAFTDECTEWENGCGNCISHTNYPPSILDFSKTEFKKKRGLINALSDQLVMVALTDELACLYKKEFPKIRIETIGNGLDLETESELSHALKSAHFNYRNHDLDEYHKVKVLVIANDLSYAGKTNPEIVNSILDNNLCEVHTIGKNSPFVGDNVVNHGAINSREELVLLYSKCDVMLFTSVVDTYPLVIIESLTCGLPVVAIESPASVAVLGAVGAKSVKVESIGGLLTKDAWWSLYSCNNKRELSKQAINIFSGKNMFSKYLKLYNSMLEDSDVI